MGNATQSIAMTTRENQDLKIHCLLCHKHVDMAILCLGSLLKFMQEPVQLVLHDDGSLTDIDQERLQQALLRSTIVSRPQADDLVNEGLRNYPNCQKFRKSNVLALKLFDIPLLSDGDIAYCDSDILFLRPFSHMWQWPDDEVSALFMVDNQEAYSVHPWHLLGQDSLKLPSRANTGLIYFRRRAYDLDFLEWILGQPKLQGIFAHLAGWAEQTCWVAMGHRAGCRLWQPDQVAVFSPTMDLNPTPIALHFISTYRGYLEHYAAKMGDEAFPPIKISTIAAQELNIFKFANFKLQKRVKRQLKLT
ncbi:hypothetical protein Pse7367_0718 [Thalassoporum mexicanum PCC 7367]|uniref:hypothetical protein n=1 Tax=Thalassoporum mexicanum TaxID=3457544 RepID=UPI00029FB2BF|nr:hypothetical protein [Pseudanabaena sp. PCC 7367]AFY69020.1 hypothetical protein Pse7367_0718 [Pseudanabaena sp. PCC 7367]